jgi:hypothetical protein
VLLIRKLFRWAGSIGVMLLMIGVPWAWIEHRHIRRSILRDFGPHGLESVDYSLPVFLRLITAAGLLLLLIAAVLGLALLTQKIASRYKDP